MTELHAECIDVPKPRHDDLAILAGDVYSINESIYAAVYDILRLSNVADRRLFSRCREAAGGHTLKSQATPKTRPCIVMEDVPHCHTVPASTLRNREICLATSWEKTPLTDLPMLFQFFSVPIHRNHNISPEHPDHCHSLPEWDTTEDAFLFAWRFKTTRPLINRWPQKESGEPPEEPCVFGQKAWDSIVEICEAKRREWFRMCEEDPTFADARARECLIHYNKWSAERDKTNDALSVVSIQTGFTFNSAFTCGTRVSRLSSRSRQSALSACESGPKRRPGGIDSDSWRRPSYARTGSESFVSMQPAVSAIHEGTAISRSKPPKVRDADGSSVVRAASNRFSIYRDILIPSRRGSRDY